jgi:L-ascorbate metabolism protein UlaG (beta-lactamase superfamily)
MKAAFQTGEAFLSEVRRALGNSERKLWWLGQSGFLLVQNGRALLLDPYLSDSLTRKYAETDKPHVRITERVVAPDALGGLQVIDVITSSHNHTDHLDPETLLPLLTRNPQAKLVIASANRDFVRKRLGANLSQGTSCFESFNSTVTGLSPSSREERAGGVEALGTKIYSGATTSQLVEINDETSVRAGSIQIHGVASAHPTVERDAAGRCLFLGYVVQWNGLTLYHSGDTLMHQALIPSLQRFKIDIALLPINGDKPERRVAGNLDGIQAAQLAKAVGARIVIPCHYDLFEFNTATPDPFMAECERIQQPFRILRNGEGMKL